MKKPPVVRPTDEVRLVGHLFGTPVVVKDTTWLPVTEFAVWLLMSWLAGRGRDDCPWRKRLGTGALTMSAILGSILALFATLSLVVGFGLLKEQ
jgi:hypothetical protein